MCVPDVLVTDTFLAVKERCMIGCRESNITEIDITEMAINIREFYIMDTAIMESDITRKGKLL